MNAIVAISTPVGAGGIGIIRVSGSDALKIADAVFYVGGSAKFLSKIQSRGDLPLTARLSGAASPRMPSPPLANGVPPFVGSHPPCGRVARLLAQN